MEIPVAENHRHDLHGSTPGVGSVFDVQPIIKQNWFESPSVQGFFMEWCEANDSIRPKFIDREEWNKLKDGFLVDAQNGTKTLYLPYDLKLWEIAKVVEVIDTDTFTDKSDKGAQASERLKELGKTFMSSGVYIARRLENIEGGQDIAKSLAEDFYQYGQALTTGEEGPSVSIEEIEKINLTPEETEAIDRFLAGNELYVRRRAIVDGAGEGAGQIPGVDRYEEMRQKALQQFFRVAQMSFNLKARDARGELLKDKEPRKPWQDDTSVHRAFLRRANESIGRQVSKPQTELVASMHRRGMELLRTKMPFGESLNDIISGNARRELEQLRIEGNKEAVAKMERAIADKIQKAVEQLCYDEGSNRPSEMVCNKTINCLGASMLGIVLMERAGLRSLVADLLAHSMILLVTSDGQVEIRDMLDSRLCQPLTNETVSVRSSSGRALTVGDIATFSQNNEESDVEQVTCQINDEVLLDVLECWQVIVYRPEDGLQVQALGNLSITLQNLGQYDKTIEVLQQALLVSHGDIVAHNNLGVTFDRLGQYHEAIEPFQRALEIDPGNELARQNLDIVLGLLQAKSDS